MRFLKNIYFKGIFWNSLNQFGKSGFQLIVTLVLARLLSPADFGAIAMVLIITQFAELLIDSGFILGVVQVESITQKELSSVFYLNLAIGLTCTLTIYCVAPWISSLYDNPELTKVARYLSFTCIFSSLAVVQHGLMIREMNYKKRTIAQLISQFISGLLAIWLALKGFGVMALVFYSLIQSGLSAFLYWLQSSWRPDLSFSIRNLKRVWAFSSNILGVTLLGNIAGRVDLFLVGRFFNSSMMGFYSKGKDFAMLPATIGGEVVSISLFPILSRLKGEAFNRSFQVTLKIILFFSSILFALLSINGREITTILLGPTWKDASTIFQLYFIVAFFYMLNAFFTSIINATGRSRVNLNKELIQAPIRIVSLFVIYYAFKPANTEPFIYFWIIYYVISYIYSQYLICKICKLNFFNTLVVGSQYILFALGAGIFSFFALNSNEGLATVFLRTSLFILLFGIGIVITKDSILKQTKKFLKNRQI